MNEVTEAPDLASQFGGLIFALVLLDPQGTIVQANPAAEDLLGRSVQRLLGKRFTDLVQVQDSRVEAGLKVEDSPLVARDVEIGTGSGRRRVNLTSSPLLTHPGWRAITLSDAGMGQGEQVDDFELRAPAVLAHEIKNPLAAIRGAGQLLSRRVEPRDRQMAEIIARETDRIADLVDRMQQLGSAASAERGGCNLHEAVRSAVSSIRTGRGNNVEIVEEFDPSLPAVGAGRAALEQVLINLLANACEATASATSPRVEVRTRFVSGLIFNVVRLGKATRLPIEIIVSDNGPGIAPELRDHVFEPFVSGKPQGQGLGLALVRKLVRDMGGRIAHERDEKRGWTLFRINLALAEEKTA